MDYTGTLWGKIGRQFVPLKLNSQQVDALQALPLKLAYELDCAPEESAVVSAVCSLKRQLWQSRHLAAHGHADLISSGEPVQGTGTGSPGLSSCQTEEGLNNPASPGVTEGEPPSGSASEGDLELRIAREVLGAVDVSGLDRRGAGLLGAAVAWFSLTGSRMRGSALTLAQVLSPPAPWAEAGVIENEGGAQ